MAFPSRPSNFTIKEHGRMIKGIIRDFATDSLRKYGLTPSDVSAAEDYGWEVILSAFINQYDVSGWGASPPKPLFQIWDLLASGHLLRMAANRGQLQQQTNPDETTWKVLINDGRGMIKSILDPKDEGDRLTLMDPGTGDAIYPDEAVTEMEVADARLVEFWPALNSDMSHSQTTSQNIENFFRDRNM